MRKLSLDDARLLPHLRPGSSPRDVHDAGRDALASPASPVGKVPVGDDWERLRGLPMMARGVRGASPGSNPEQALLAKERRRRR